MNYQLVAPGPIEDLKELRVLEWHGGPGRVFAPGDLILEMETHKAVIEVRAAQPGVLRQVLCEPGAWMAIGGTLAVLSDEPDEAIPASLADLEEWPVEFQIG